MDVYEAIYSRRTVRDFKEKEIDIEIIKRIIDAGLRAPSNNHMREWEFIIIDEKSVKLKIFSKINVNNNEEDAIRIIDSWGLIDEYQREMYIDAIQKRYQTLLNAGCIIIPCFRLIDPILKPKNLSGLNPLASIWCCIENILLAAVNEGIYGVTRVPVDTEIIHLKEITCIPNEYEIPCYIALGYPNENAKRISQHLVSAKERMHFNKWSR